MSPFQLQSWPGMWLEISYSAISVFTLIDPAHTVTTEVARVQEDSSDLTKYFSVVWCKASKKKHKKWEGDAVLIARGKLVTLKDMEGKDIGRGNAMWGVPASQTPMGFHLSFFSFFPPFSMQAPS